MPPGDRLNFNPQEDPVEVRNDHIRRFYFPPRGPPQLLEVARALQPANDCLVHGEKREWTSCRKTGKRFRGRSGREGKDIT